MPETISRRQKILNATSDVALNLVAYDRKGDEDLRLGQIEDALRAGEITLKEIGDHFLEAFKKHSGVSEDRECVIYGADVCNGFELRVSEMGLRDQAEDVWNNPERYNDHYDFLKYLWVRSPEGKVQRFYDYCKSAGIAE